MRRLLLMIVGLMCLPAVGWAGHLPVPFVPLEGVFGERFLLEYAAPAHDLPTTIRFIVNFVLGIVAVVALAALVYGGFRYVVSRGEENEIEAAKGIITNAVIGLIVIGIAAAIVNFVVGAILTPTVDIRGTLPGPT